MQNAQSWSRRFASLERIWPRRIGSVGSNTTALCAAQHVTRWTWHDLATQHKKLQELLFLKQKWWALSDTIGPVLHQGHMYGTAVIAWRKPYEHRMDCILHPFLHRIRKGGLEVLGVLENCATLAFLVTTSATKRSTFLQWCLSPFGVWVSL